MVPRDIPEYRVHSTPSRVEHWRHLVEIIALVIAAIWAAYVFVYQERIKPAAAPVDVQFTVPLTHELLPNGSELIAIAPTWKNIGATDAQVIGMVINGYGARYAAAGSVRHEYGGGFEIALWDRARARRALVLRLKDFFAPAGTTRRAVIRPGETLTFSYTAVVGRAEYDTFTVQFAQCVQRADDLTRVPYEPLLERDGSYRIAKFYQRMNRPGVRCTVTTRGREYGL